MADAHDRKPDAEETMPADETAHVTDPHEPADATPDASGAPVVDAGSDAGTADSADGTADRADATTDSADAPRATEDGTAADDANASEEPEASSADDEASVAATSVDGDAARSASASSENVPADDEIGASEGVPVADDIDSEDDRAAGDNTDAAAADVSATNDNAADSGEADAGVNDAAADDGDSVTNDSAAGAAGESGSDTGADDSDSSAGESADGDYEEGVDAEVADAELGESDDDFKRPAAEIKAIVEALIFASPDPLTPKSLLKLLDSEPKEDVLAALEELKVEYERQSGLQLVEVAGGFQIVTRPDLHEWVRRLFHERSTQKLSVQALESLAVIAYRQPITAIEITEIRGVNTSGVLNTLLERHLVKIVGRKQVVGRPFMYATTKEFLIRFGLKDLSDLPRVEDMAESLGIESRLLVEQTPPEEQLPLSEPEGEELPFTTDTGVDATDGADATDAADEPSDPSDDEPEPSVH